MTQFPPERRRIDWGFCALALMWLVAFGFIKAIHFHEETQALQRMALTAPALPLVPPMPIQLTVACPKLTERQVGKWYTIIIDCPAPGKKPCICTWKPSHER